MRALVKLEQVLPDRLRHRVNALQAYTVAAASSGPEVDPQLLAQVATACRDHHVLRIDYRKHDGTGSTRSIEPHRLVHWGRRWYLVAWDRGPQRLAQLPRRPAARRPGESCVVHAYGSTPEVLALHLAWLDVDFFVSGPPELVACLTRLSARFGAAVVH